MAQGIPFHGMNDTINPPPGDEGTIASLALFRSRGGANVSCHELDDEELEEVTRTGRVYLSNFSGRTFFPVFVGSEETVRAVVADTGPTFERTPDDKQPPSRSAVRFNLAPALVALAKEQGAGIELEVDGPSRIKAHIVAGDVGGNVPLAMPIALETVIATVLAVRELVDADDRNAASSCGVRDQLGELEQWLDGHGVDVDARCYPARTMSGPDFIDSLLDDEPINPRKHEAATPRPPEQAGEIQDHKAYPRIAKLIGDCVHHNGGTAGRVFQGIADPEADIMRLLDECLGAEGVYATDLKALDDWLGKLSAEDFDTVTDGEDAEVGRLLESAPGVGNATAREWIDAAYEHCICTSEDVGIGSDGAGDTKTAPG